MDPDQFLALVQRLITAQNRREAVAGAVGGALASLGITTVAESRRKRAHDHGNAAGRGKKKKNRRHDHNDDRRHDGSADRPGQRQHKRKRGKDKNGREKKNKKNKNNHDDRCKKNGQPCVKDSKCCSKHCDANSGTCIRKPGS